MCILLFYSFVQNNLRKEHTSEWVAKLWPNLETLEIQDKLKVTLTIRDLIVADITKMVLTWEHGRQQ